MSRATEEEHALHLHFVRERVQPLSCQLHSETEWKVLEGVSNREEPAS